jgi:hypothetical protein
MLIAYPVMVYAGFIETGIFEPWKTFKALNRSLRH